MLLIVNRAITWVRAETLVTVSVVCVCVCVPYTRSDLHRVN